MTQHDLSNYTVAVLGAGAVGRAVAADCKLGGNQVRLYDLPEFAETSLKNLDRTGITLEGKQWNKYNFTRSGTAKFDLVSTDLAAVVAGAQLIIVAIPSIGHNAFFEKLVPLLEDGVIVHIIPDNFGSLKLRKKMRELRSTKKVIIGGWSSAPYGTRIIKEAGVDTSRVLLRYRAISLRAASLPSTDQEEFLASSAHLGCFDSVTFGDGPASGKTVLDIDFSNVNPVLHCPGTLLGVGVMENFGRVFGGNDSSKYSIYSYAFCESISEVQYSFYSEEVELAHTIGVDVQHYDKKDFFSRSNILGPEYMGDGAAVPFEEQYPMAIGTGPFDIHDRYITEDIPVGCHIYHELGKKFNVSTNVIDSMITIASAMVGTDFYKTGVTLDDLGIGDLDKPALLDYLENGTY